MNDSIRDENYNIIEDLEFAVEDLDIDITEFVDAKGLRERIDRELKRFEARQ